MKRTCEFATAFTLVLVLQSAVTAGPFSPAAGQPNSTAVSNTSPKILAWATGFEDLVRGPLDIANPGLGNASFGTGAEGVGPASGAPGDVVSLGDGGQITLTFGMPLIDRPGADFAVYENGFQFGSDSFLELAFVEVSSDGVNFFRFDAVSLTQTVTQLGAFDPVDPTNVNNLAGKYVGGFGTPFDLNELDGVSVLLDTNNVTHVRLIDTVGSLNPAHRTLDSLGNPINEPYPTAFASGGFDLDGVAVLHEVPEPTTWIMLLTGVLCMSFVHRLRRHA